MCQVQLQRPGGQLVPKHPARDRRATVELLLTCSEAIDLQRCSDVSPQVQDQLRMRKVLLIGEPFVHGLVDDAFDGGVQSAPRRPTRLPWL